MELPFKTIIILVIVILVAAVSIFFIIDTISSAEESGWSILGVGEKKIRDAEEAEPDLCFQIGHICVNDGQCCGDLVCRRESPEDEDRVCSNLAELGGFCEADRHCINNNCGRVHDLEKGTYINLCCNFRGGECSSSNQCCGTLICDDNFKCS